MRNFPPNIRTQGVSEVLSLYLFARIRTIIVSTHEMHELHSKRCTNRVSTAVYSCWRPAIITDHFGAFPQSLQTNGGMVPEFPPTGLLPSNNHLTTVILVYFTSAVETAA